MNGFCPTCDKNMISHIKQLNQYFKRYSGKLEFPFPEMTHLSEVYELEFTDGALLNA